MTRVLVLTSLYPPHHLGGLELSCHDVVTRLGERGHDVAVLCADSRLPGVADPTGPEEERVHRRLGIYLRDGELWSPSIRQRVAVERQNQAALAHMLAEHRPEVVSVWHMGAMSLGLLSALARRKVPVVYAVCDEWPVYETRLDAWARLWWGSTARQAAGRVTEHLTGLPCRVPDLGSTGAFLWVSDLTRRRVEANTTWDYSCSTVVYSGVDTRVFPPVPAPPDRQWRWRMVYAGRFDPRKGPETAVRALSHLPPEASLHLYGRGGGPERRRLAAIASDLGVEERVTFAEAGRDQLAAAYQDADVVVFPSEWEEPFGLVPLEAMACGTPVVATGMGGSAEFLTDGGNCLLFAPRDASGLAAAVSRLGAEPALRCRLVQGGLATVTQLDADRLADVFEAWHSAVAEGFAAGRPPDRRPVWIAGLTSEHGARNLQSAMTADPLSAHQASAPGVLAEGDPAAIKRLYVDLGRDWWEAHADEVDTIPVLSAAENHPVVVNLLRDVKGLVLDAGCGPNPAISMALAGTPVRSVVSLDIGWGTVRVARQFAQQRGLRIMGVVGDVEQLPFRSGAFDSVVCDDTIEHLPDDRLGVSELARVSRPGATVVLATPNRHNVDILRQKLGDRARSIRKPASQYFVSNSHIREYTWGEFERLIAPVFRVRRRAPVGWRRGWKSRVASRLLAAPPLRRLSQTIVVLLEPR